VSEVRIAIDQLGEGRLSVGRLSDDGSSAGQVNLADPDIILNPYPVYRELRAVSPIFRSEGLFGGSWIFLDHEDITTLLSDSVHLSNAKSRGIVDDLPTEQQGQFEKLLSLHSRWMVFFDAPKHTRLRKLIAKGFTPQVRDRLAQSVKQQVATLLGSFGGKASIDVVEDFARHIPLAAVSNLLSIPTEALPFFSRGIGDIAAYMGSEKPDLHLIKKAEQSLIEFEDFFRALITERRRRPVPDDLLSLLILAEEDGDVLSEEELFAQCTFISFTGNETTKNLISNAIYTLLSHPSQRRLLTDTPSQIGRAIDEVLRFECPVQFVGRIVKETFTYKSARLEKGEYVILMIGAGNRDPKKFREPERLDICRQDSQLVSFGAGAHTCLGKGLAHLEAEIAVGAFLAKFPNAALEPHGVKWHNNPGLRGLEYLRVSLG
jgi:cytochrome P450